MTDFNKILDKAKELEAKMNESQENIKKIRAQGVSGSNSVKVILDGNGDKIKNNTQIGANDLYFINLMDVDSNQVFRLERPLNLRNLYLHCHLFLHHSRLISSIVFSQNQGVNASQTKNVQKVPRSR